MAIGPFGIPQDFNQGFFGVPTPGVSPTGPNQQGFSVQNNALTFGTQTPGGFQPAATALTPQQRQEITNFFLSRGQPGGGEGGGGEGGGGGSALAPSAVGPNESLLAELFRGVLTGNPSGPVAETLLGLITGGVSPFVQSLGQGQVPPALRAAFEDNLQRQMAGITESFGRSGARFGTDLAGTLAGRAGEAERGFSADTISRAIQAEQVRRPTQLAGIQQLLQSAGIPVTGFEFGRSEAALNRALEEFLARQQTDPLTQLLSSLIGG